MASDMSSRRLRKEYMSMLKSPVENIEAHPLEKNILEWHYVITGTKGTPYEGGYYHGKLRFPPEYPMKPPSVLMLTPNGRFECNRRLCLSMSDFHPESWNPMWSVGTILTGLYSFMLDKASTLGSIQTSVEQKRRYAQTTLVFNSKDRHFRELFPKLMDLHMQQERERTKREEAQDIGVGGTGAGSGSGSGSGTRKRAAGVGQEGARRTGSTGSSKEGEMGIVGIALLVTVALAVLSLVLSSLV